MHDQFAFDRYDVGGEACHGLEAACLSNRIKGKFTEGQFPIWIHHT